MQYIYGPLLLIAVLLVGYFWASLIMLVLGGDPIYRTILEMWRRRKK